jgi:hypothetical protein
MSLTTDPSEMRDILLKRDSGARSSTSTTTSETPLVDRKHIQKVNFADLVFSDRIGSGGFGVVFKVRLLFHLITFQKKQKQKQKNCKHKHLCAIKQGQSRE